MIRKIDINPHRHLMRDIEKQRVREKREKRERREREERMRRESEKGRITER